MSLYQIDLKLTLRIDPFTALLSSNAELTVKMNLKCKNEVTDFERNMSNCNEARVESKWGETALLNCSIK